jgi:hypothetical protein
LRWLDFCHMTFIWLFHRESFSIDKEFMFFSQMNYISWL